MQELQSCDDLHPWREQNGKEFFPFKILNLFLYRCYNVFVISFAYSSYSLRLLKRLRELSMMLCASSVTSWGITALCTVAVHQRSPVLSQSTRQLIRYTIFRVICTPHALNPEVQEIFVKSVFKMLCFYSSAPLWNSMPWERSLMLWRSFLWHWPRTVVLTPFKQWQRSEPDKSRKTTLHLELTACIYQQMVWTTLFYFSDMKL